MEYRDCESPLLVDHLRMVKPHPDRVSPGRVVGRLQVLARDRLDPGEHPLHRADHHPPSRVVLTPPTGRRHRHLHHLAPRHPHLIRPRIPTSRREPILAQPVRLPPLPGRLQSLLTRERRQRRRGRRRSRCRWQASVAVEVPESQAATRARATSSGRVRRVIGSSTVTSTPWCPVSSGELAGDRNWYSPGCRVR